MQKIKIINAPSQAELETKTNEFLRTLVDESIIDIHMSSNMGTSSIVVRYRSDNGTGRLLPADVIS